MKEQDAYHRIGLLSSLTGTMSFSEVPLSQAAIMAVEDINAEGGVLGKKVAYVLADGASDSDVFAEKAETLISQHGITTLFGGWNSHTRRAVKNVVEDFNGLFWYPLSYEGLEESPNIFYTGSVLNQQVIPAMRWCIDQGFRRFFLLGSDYIYPITTNKLIRAALSELGGEVVTERYVPLGHMDFYDILREVQKSRPDLILNTLNGDSNLHFFRQFQDVGYDAVALPILSTAIAEPEFQLIGDAGVGHYACWTYFQSIQTPENRKFVHRFKKRFGSDRVVSDPVAMAYYQVFLWKQIVESVGAFEVDAVREGAVGQVFTTPAGCVEMRRNQHLTKHAFIGQVSSSGDIDIVWRTGLPTEPLPWLGVETLDFASVHLVRDVLALFPETIHFNVELNDRVREQSRALEKTQIRYTDFINSSSDTVSYWRMPEGLSTDLGISEQIAMLYRATCADANRTCWEGLGFSCREDLIGKRYETLMDVRQNDVIFEKFVRNAYRLSNEALHGTFVDGREYYVLSNWHGAVKGGRLTHVWISAKNITALKQAEETLKDSEARYRQLSNLSREGIVIHRGGVILDVNKAFCDIFGCDASEVVGTDPFDDLFAEESVSTVRRNIEARFKDELSVKGRRKDGAEICLEVAARDIKYNGAEARVMTLRDVTARKVAEVERERLQAQLRQSQKMESIGRLAGGIAHDFNNLLTVINGYASLAEEILRDGRSLNSEIVLIRNAGERAASLTRQLLAFSRKQVMAPRVVSFNDIITDMEKMLKRLIGEHIAFHTRLDALLGHINADPGQMEQVLVNLVVNARDAMPEGGRLTIETENVTLEKQYLGGGLEAVPGEYIRMVVRDTGGGMTRSVREHIFEPFFTTKPAGEGTGLGLATVYGIVKQSHGYIEVESALGRGAVFKINLPRVEAEKCQLRQDVETTALGGNETLLVVEDEAGVRELTCRILREAGYKVATAVHGKDALRQYRKARGKIDLVIVDVVMPGMSGKTLVEKLLAQATSLNVLFTSGYTDRAFVHHGVLDKGTHFLAKPFSTLSLLKEIRRILDGTVC